MANYPDLKADTDEWYKAGDYFAWDNNRIFFRKNGAGPVLLMVCGFPTAGSDRAEMARGFANHFTIIAPDTADARHSASPTGKTCTLYEPADMLEALMKLLGVTSLHLIGHDSGDLEKTGSVRVM
jgi:pimeloyl-ACP methyl ester carboxylesterase